jgi:hypothetical protein
MDQLIAEIADLPARKHGGDAKPAEGQPLTSTSAQAAAVRARTGSLNGAASILLSGPKVPPGPTTDAAVSNEFSNPDGWETATRFYSMMYGMCVVMANRIGEESGLHFWGGSTISDPFGHSLGRAEESETLLVSEVNYDAVRRARLQLPTVRDSNLALVGREIQRLQQRLGIPEIIRELPG